MMSSAPGGDGAAELVRATTAMTMPASARRSAHRKLRGVLLVDGTTVNCFRKNTHETHTIVLERAGHTYTYIHPDGSQTRHLSPTALSSHRAMVIETIELRNRFAWQTNSSSGLLPTAKLFDPAAQRFEIRSIEGNARVSLHPSATLVDVFYVVRARTTVDSHLRGDRRQDEDDGDPHAYYATIRQTFSLHHVPPCFAFPVQVLLHARRAASEPNGSEFALTPDEASGLFASSLLPGNSAFSARPTFAALSTSHSSSGGDGEGGRAAGDGEDALALADVLRVASRPTRQLYARVAVEATESATFYICKPGRDVLPSVIVQLAQQNTVIECTRGFFRWYGETGELQQQFTVETIPPATLFGSADSSASVLTLCNHAMDLLRSHGGGGSSSIATIRDGVSDEDSETTSDSTVIVEAAETEHGRFRAFADGRVRVVFQDRTILQVDATRERCAFFFADGTAGQTTCAAAPPSQREYIHRALEFADWAFATPRERMLRYVRRQLNEEVAHQELQKIGIRFGMNDGSVGLASQATSGSNGNRSEQQTQEQHADSRTDDTPHYLTPPMIRQLQEATQQHIASVNMLLHAPPAAVRPDPNL